MAVGRKSQQGRRASTGGSSSRSLDDAGRDIIRNDCLGDDTSGGKPEADDPQAARGRRIRQGVAQFPMQILVPEETRNALRQRSEDTGASIRHIILRSLAADGFPVPRLTRKRG